MQADPTSQPKYGHIHSRVLQAFYTAQYRRSAVTVQQAHSRMVHQCADRCGVDDVRRAVAELVAAGLLCSEGDEFWSPVADLPPGERAGY